MNNLLQGIQNYTTIYIYTWKYWQSKFVDDFTPNQAITNIGEILFWW